MRLIFVQQQYNNIYKMIELTCAHRDRQFSNKQF